VTGGTGPGRATAGAIGTGEIAAAVRDLLDPLDAYEPDGRWSESAERAACGRLTQAVGPQQATLGCLFGETWDARTAVTAGLAAAVVEPPERVLDAAVTLGQRLAHQEKAFVQRLVATLRSSVTTADYADALAAETEAQRWSAGRPAFRDGVTEPEARIARQKS
jgi:enoyl-CoA hydratase/carnithine racemase